MKNNRFVLLLMATAIMLTMLSACSQEKPNDNVKDNEMEDANKRPDESVEYTVSVNDGVYAVKINDSDDQLPQFGYTHRVLVFKSIAEMVTCFKNNDLNQYQLEVIKYKFPMNDNGEYVVGNLDDLYSPVLPQNIPVDWVELYNGGYRIDFDWGTNEYGIMHIHTDGQRYEQWFAEYYTNFFDSEYNIITETYHVADRDAEVIDYTNGDDVFRKIRYTIDMPQRTMIVDETYWIERGDESTETSEIYPRDVWVYVEEGDVKYTIWLRSSGIGSVLSERPTVDWLTSIKLEKYVHTGDLVTE